MLVYCNALYVGISAVNFNKLQRVQNTLARVILKRRKFDHIAPSLVELHWLPIRQRTTFKLATLTYKLIHSSQDHYLSHSLHFYRPGRNLQSSIKNLYLLLERSQRLVLLNIPHSPSGTVCHLTFEILTLYLALDVS
jgi:hypothetical protein